MCVCACVRVCVLSRAAPVGVCVHEYMIIHLPNYLILIELVIFICIDVCVR